MAGRLKSEQGDEKREYRTVIRWTKTEKKRIDQVKKKLGLSYDVDVIRMFTLKGVGELLPPDDKGVAE